MASIINAATSGGLISTADTSGILQLQTAGTTAVTVDASQNVGVGVTPSASNLSTIQSTYGLFVGNSETNINCNAYYNSGFKYVQTGAATGYRQGSGRHEWYNAVSGTAGNAVSFTTSMVLNANGALALQGASLSADGVGITFPATQSASSDANTLDDYEEGTFAFTVKFGASNADSVSTIFTGYYTKVGRAVSIQGSFNIITKSAATGNLTITGLPFSVFDPSAVYIGGVFEMGFTDYPSARIDTGTTIQFFQTTNAGSRSALTDSNCINNFSFQFSSTYFTT